MLVLASASPRRQELLRSAGISFAVQPANIDETPRPNEAPREYTERLASEKARAVWRLRPQDRVLGADTTVVVDGTILGKPVDSIDAARMLRLLSGHVHRVITGVCVIGSTSSSESTVSGEGHRPSFFEQTASETTLVTMNELSDQEISDYIATGEPMDKAGAYAIQGMASRWIPRIEGDYSNVVGLPVALVYAMLSKR